MTAVLAEIWRHPIKSHGRQAVDRITLQAGSALPGDRMWGVAHADARLECQEGWSRCANFLRATHIPALMAITAETRGAQLTLRHPNRPMLTFNPDTDTQAYLDWIAPLIPEDRPAPVGLVPAGARGMTDSAFPSIAIHGFASHRAVENQLDAPISHHRWRGNLWLDGLAPWEEMSWIGRTLRIGHAEIAIRERIGRCKATHANPDTGTRDMDMLAALRAGFGHQDFGVYGEVIAGGEIAAGDPIVLLP